MLQQFPADEAVFRVICVDVAAQFVLDGKAHRIGIGIISEIGGAQRDMEELIHKDLG